MHLFVHCFLHYYCCDVHIKCVWWMVLSEVYSILVVLLVLHILSCPLICVLLYEGLEKVICMVCGLDTICYQG